MKEIWKDIKDFEGLYQVSNFGRVRSLSRLVNSRNGKRTAQGKILFQNTYPNTGYKHVTLSKHSKCKRYSVHRLVAETFIPNPDNLPCVNHKDETRTNNRVDNLEWCTYKYNSNYGTSPQKVSAKMYARYKQDLMWKNACVTRLDIFHQQRKKQVCQLDLMGNLLKVWDSTVQTAQDGFVPNDVGACANHKRLTHHGYKWQWYSDYVSMKEGD